MSVRRWAFAHWIERFPLSDLVGMARGLLDEDEEVHRAVATHLGRTRSPRWLPVLARALELTEGRRRLAVIDALGELGQAGATDHLLPILRAPGDGLTLISTVRALGALRCDASRKALLDLLRRATHDDAFSALIVRGLLHQGAHADFIVIVRAWRTWHRARTSATERAILDAMGLDVRAARSLARMSARGPGAVLRLADPQPGLIAGADARLDAAYLSSPPELLKTAHSVLVETVVARRDDLQGWMHEAGGDARADYRALARMAEGLLAALRTGEVDDEHASSEQRVAVGALLALAGREDDEAALRRAADADAEAWRLFSAPRRGVAPAVLARVLAQERRAVPRLAELLASDAAPEVLGRAAEALAQLSDRGVSVIAATRPAVEAAIAARGTPLSHGVIDALVAIGPPAVPALIEGLGDDDDALLDALGRIPTPEAVEALQTQLRDAVIVPTPLLAALADTGDPSALDLLAPAWSPGAPALAALLSTLAQVLGVEHPDRAAWLADLADEPRYEAVLALARSAVPAES